MVPIEGREVSVAGREISGGGSREVSVGGSSEDVVVSQRSPEVRGEGIWGKEAAEVTRAAEVRGRAGLPPSRRPGLGRKDSSPMISTPVTRCEMK